VLCTDNDDDDDGQSIRKALFSLKDYNEEEEAS
jgi:hypothetical protein